MPGYADALSVLSLQHQVAFLHFTPVSNVSSARTWRRLSLGVTAREPSLCKNDARARTATGAGGTERVRDEAPGPGTTRHT